MTGNIENMENHKVEEDCLENEPYRDLKGSNDFLMVVGQVEKSRKCQNRIKSEAKCQR